LNINGTDQLDVFPLEIREGVDDVVIGRLPLKGKVWAFALTYSIPLESFAVPLMVILPVFIVGGYGGYVILIDGER